MNMRVCFHCLLLSSTLWLFSSCDQPKLVAHSTKKDTAPLALKPSVVPLVDTSYVIDTLAILTNRRLDTLLAALQQAPLVQAHSVQALPPVVTSFLARVTQNEFSVADPGQPYQATDMVEEGLPTRQLLYLGQGNNLLLLAYNKGGIGLSERILLFKLQDQKILDFWTGYVKGTLTTKQQLLDYLQTNKDKKWGVNTNVIYF